LTGFKQIEVGEDSGSGDVDDERAKFIVEKLVDEWLDYYELTKPGSYVKRHFKNSKFRSSETSELSAEFEKGKEGKDLSSGVYHSAWKFDKDGFVGKRESYEPTRVSGVKGSAFESKESKHCSSCDSNFFTSARFCENCGKKLENKISEIVAHETSDPKDNRKDGSGGGSGLLGGSYKVNAYIAGSTMIISLIGLFIIR